MVGQWRTKRGRPRKHQEHANTRTRSGQMETKVKEDQGPLIEWRATGGEVL